MKESDEAHADDEFSTEGEYVHDPVPEYEKFHGTALSPTEEVITAMEMARLTFHGEQEFRSKVNVEIIHNLDVELARVVSLCRSSGVQGSSWFTYDHTQWSEWLKKGPELSKDTTDVLARRKTRMREHMILESLKKRLEWEGYTCNITRPYRGSESDKDYLYVQWSKPKPSLSKETCWRNLMACIRLFILASIILVFLVSFAALFTFTGWLLYTRWEKLELL